jgi:hypothetical protein
MVRYKQSLSGLLLLTRAQFYINTRTIFIILSMYQTAAGAQTLVLVLEFKSNICHAIRLCSSSDTNVSRVI